MKLYREFTIRTQPFIPDIVTGFLWDLDISGINEDIDSLIIFSDEGTEVSKENVTNLLQELVNQNIITSFEIEVRTCEYKNWNEEWEKGLNIIEVTDNIVIKPSNKNYENTQNKIVITIDPKMSFGTGEHQTTKLALRLMERYLRKGMKVLDVGTGTGILSIAAVKLGAGSAKAIDNDEWFLDNTRENCKINNAGDKIEIMLSEIREVEEKDFDLILANIQKNVLMDISEEIKEKLAGDGIVILSGLLIEDEKVIVERYKELKFLEHQAMGEWIALVFQKK